MKFYSLLAIALSGYLMSNPPACNQACKSTITVTPERTQVSTRFKVNGKNFAPGKQVSLSITNRPAPLGTTPWPCDGVFANAQGEFSAICEVSYLSGRDDRQRSPYIVASDGTCAGVKTVSSAYWFPQGGQ